MRKIYKYVIPVDGKEHELDIRGDILHVGCSDGSRRVLLWAEFSEDSDSVFRTFRAYQTGQIIPDGAQYIGTCLVSGTAWHLYERLDYLWETPHLRKLSAVPDV